jgi:hypothetical protein
MLIAALIKGDTSKVDLYRLYGALYALPLMASL